MIFAATEDRARHDALVDQVLNGLLEEITYMQRDINDTQNRARRPY